MQRTTVLAALLIFGSLAIGAAAFQQGPQDRKIDVEKLKDNLYVLTSSSPADRSTFSGGNVAVFITDNGVVLVDTKLAAWGDVLLERIKSITNKPVTTIINTHTHGDHTGNNDKFGATIDSIVHENTKANMARMDAFKGDKAQFLPKRTYKDKATVGRGRDQVDLYYFGPGHTSGDTFVVFPALRVVHTGDMFAWKDAPSIDRSNGGSGVEFPRTLAKMVAGIKNVDTVIPGHSPVTTWKDLQEFQRFTNDLLTQTQTAMKAGKSPDDAAASIDLAAKYPGYKSERVKAAVQAIYEDLKGRSEQR
jgi:glyoxylase-like metal-dependent hydrolase (beta-lactamase superfamily II)